MIQQPMRKGFIESGLLLLLAMTVAGGCTHESMDDCYSGVNLRFRFTLHEESEKGDLFGQNVAHVRVYVFDESGILQQVATQQGAVLTNDYVMPLSLEPGRYSIVAWASDNEVFTRTHTPCCVGGGQPSAPAFQELEVGKSRMEELRMALKCEPLVAESAVTKPTDNHFDDLYYGAVGTRSTDGKSQYSIVPIEVKPAEYVDREVELIRNTSIVRITIEGLQHLSATIAKPEELFDIRLRGANAQYQYQNVLCMDAPTVNYTPQYSHTAVHTLQADLKIERMEWAKQGDNWMKLFVKLRDGKTLYDGGLMALLKEAKDAEGNRIYGNQEDVDRIYLHPIRFVIAKDEESQDLYIKIFIHNWELVTLVPEL